MDLTEPKLSEMSGLRAFIGQNARTDSILACQAPELRSVPCSLDTFAALCLKWAGSHGLV
jgi:hypothetical protein